MMQLNLAHTKLAVLREGSTNQTVPSSTPLQLTHMNSYSHITINNITPDQIVMFELIHKNMFTADAVLGPCVTEKRGRYVSVQKQFQMFQLFEA